MTLAQIHTALVAAGMDRYQNRPEGGQLFMCWYDLEQLRDEAAVRALVAKTNPITCDKGLVWND